MRRSDIKWLQSAISLVVLAAALLTAPPAVAGTASFSINMAGQYFVVPVNISDGEGGTILDMAYLQPLTGSVDPFGQCQAILTSASPGTGQVDSPTATFTLANGMTITASIVYKFGLDPSQPSTVTATITSGTGIFEDATGTFTATITPNMAAHTTTSFPVTFTGSGTLTAPKAPGGLTVLPPVLTFDVAQGATSPVSKTVVLDNEGLNAETFQVSATTVSGGNWLSVSRGSGTVAVAATSAITVTADPAAASPALKPGLYEGLVTVTYRTVSIPTKVHLIVGGMGATLELSETGLTFQGGEGGYPSHAETIQVRNPGVGSLDALTAKTSVTGTGTNWLHAAITPVAGDPQTSNVAISADPLPAGVGNYYGRVDFSLPNAANSPQSVTVALQIMAGPLPDVTPAAVAFSYNYVCGAPGASVPPQTVKLTNLSKQPLSFTVTGGSVSPNGLGYPKNGAAMDWLMFSPTASTIGPGGSATLTVQVAAACFGGPTDPCGLQYFNVGGISVAFKEDSYTVAIPVHLAMDNVCDFQLPSGPQGPAGGLFIAGGPADATGRATGIHPRAAASCLPWQLYGAFTSLLSGFRATVGLPVPIEVRIVDSCGKTMDGGAAVATFSNGDPALTLTSIGDGHWTGTWTPQASAAQATITVKAAKLGTAAGMFQLTGGVAFNASTPIAYAGGIANAASGVAAVAPGSFVAIYGADFTTTSSEASANPFPALLGGTQVLLGGEPLPLYFTSSGQIDAIVPYDIAPNSMHQAIVLNGAASSQPQPVAVGTAQPGVFTQNQTGSGPGSILGQKVGGDPALNTAANPASAGDYLWIYCTGLGTVTPGIAAGAAATYPPLYNTDNAVTVTVGGLDAHVAFAGLAPGYVGLYQVNAIVPAGVAPGASVPVVVTAAGASSAPVTVAID
jgi:uncharacterized protein (TIGR03437 family)